MYIEINGVAELRAHLITDDHVKLGANITLSKAIELLLAASKLEGFEYTAYLAKHWARIANTPVRNVGTIAGNLMIKYTHREFPSDIFITLEGIGAKLAIGEL